MIFTEDKLNGLSSNLLPPLSVRAQLGAVARRRLYMQVCERVSVSLLWKRDFDFIEISRGVKRAYVTLLAWLVWRHGARAVVDAYEKCGHISKTVTMFLEQGCFSLVPVAISSLLLDGKMLSKYDVDADASLQRLVLVVKEIERWAVFATIDVEGQIELESIFESK